MNVKWFRVRARSSGFGFPHPPSSATSFFFVSLLSADAKKILDPDEGKSCRETLIISLLQAPVRHVQATVHLFSRSIAFCLSFTKLAFIRYSVPTNSAQTVIARSHENDSTADRVPPPSDQKGIAVPALVVCPQEPATLINNYPPAYLSSQPTNKLHECHCRRC
jgi:hypothetical protein